MKIDIIVPIEGVSTTTTGFIGPARYGPVDLTPELVTSLGDFERVYSDGRQLEFSGLEPVDNYLWHAVRSFFVYLEHSVDKGTQWVVFEPNGDPLWANVRRTIEDFLLNEWQNGALLGDKPEKAFFVRCDRSTMTQNDLDNGRLVCLIGVALLRPAEFVIFHIGQWTADANRKCISNGGTHV